MTTPPVLRLVRARRKLAPQTGIALGAIAFLGMCVALWPPTSTMSDLRVYFAAARGFVDGADIYTIHRRYEGMGLGFTYPPFAAIVMAPLAIGEEFARLLITLASGAALLVIGNVTVRAVRPRWSKGRQRAAGLLCSMAALLLEPVSSTFGLGQVNLVLLALLLLDLLGHTPRRFRGVLLGVATGIKLTPGLFIVFLLLTRRFREAAIASATTAATLLAGWLAMPGPATDFWTRYIFDPGRPGPAHYISNQSLRGAIARLTANSGLTGSLWLLAATAIGCAGLVIARRLDALGRPLDALVITAYTALLVSPISWSNHWVWALPAVVLLWTRAVGAGERIFAGVWTAVFALGLPWWVPFARDQELHLNLPQTLAGDSYTIAAIALLAVGLLSTLRPGRADAEPAGHWRQDSAEVVR